MVLNATTVKLPTMFTRGLFNNALGFDDIPNLYPSFTTLPFSKGSGVKVPWDLNIRCDFVCSKSLLLDEISSDR